MTSAGMTSSKVHRVLEALSSIGCRAWIEGGLGVDALVGRQTRLNRDLDLAFDDTREQAAVAVLQSLGYVLETDWRPVRFDFAAGDDRCVDMHPLALDADGKGVQGGFDEQTFTYPASCFVTGELDHRTVPCLSVEQQLKFHSAYAPRPIDLADIALLNALTRFQSRRLGQPRRKKHS